MIAPLSLSNVFTVMIAVACLTTIAAQSRGEVTKLWRLAVPASLAAVQALILLASVFEASFVNDAEWLIAAIAGSVVGRARGWAMPIAVDQTRSLIRLRRSLDGQIAAVGLVICAFVDFTGAALDEAIIPCEHTAAATALFAGYIACRSLAIAVRASRVPNLELIDPQRMKTTSPV